MLPELFLAFPLGVCPIRVIVNNHYIHVFPFLNNPIEMFIDGFDCFGLYGGTVIVGSSAKITCLPNELFRKT